MAMPRNIFIPYIAKKCTLNSSSTFLTSGTALDLGRVLGCPSGTPRGPHLLCFLTRQKVHVCLPDVRARHEREDPETDRHLEPLQIQAHLESKECRPLRRHRAVRGSGQPGHDAERAVAGALRIVVHREAQRGHNSRLLRRGDPGKAHPVSAGRNRDHERAEVAPQVFGRLHLVLGPYRLPADERVRQDPQTHAHRTSPRGAE